MECVSEDAVFLTSKQLKKILLRCGPLQRPGHCPEIPEILKLVLKCPKFTPCPEFFADILKFLSTPVNGVSH